MSDLRIVLLGKSVSENSLVGNFILGRAVFDSEAAPDVVERVGGRLKDRHLMIINSPQLLQTNISDHQITQTVRECVFLSDPGPHVILLLLKHEPCSAEDQELVEKVLGSFSEQVYQHTMVLSTQETNETNDILQKIIQKCANRHFSLQKSSSPEDLLQMFEDIVQINDGSHLDCGSQNLTVEQQTTERLSEAVKLNLVVCGSDGMLKSSISELILQQTDGELHGRQISVIELPALTRLSEEEVMRQTLNCVSLCDPGVHVFIIIIPDAPLTVENKTEIEKIQRIFDSREHFILLLTTTLSVEGSATKFVESSTESQRLISLYGGQYRVMGIKEPENSRQIAELLEYIENMKTEPYSLQMYVKAQENRVRHELEEQHKKELKRMENKIKEIKQKSQPEGAECSDDQESLRIVIGRTGNGKSATGNTILGRNEFESKASTDSLTTVCKKRIGEVDGRSVAVIDTPGLFDTSLSNDQVAEEIMKCVSLSSPGPHVFVIVLSVTRFTKEEADTVDLIMKIFGPKAAQFSIVLFTRGDELEGESVEDYVERSKSAELKKLIRDCGNRFLAFNNREKQDKTQVSQLLKMIEEVKNSNQGRYFTNSMFEEAEMSIKMRMYIEYKEKNEMERHYERLEQERKEEWERRKREDDERREEDRKRWQTMIEYLKQEREEEFKRRETERKESEKKERDEMKRKHEKEIKQMKKKHEDEAIKQAEELHDFRGREKRHKEQVREKQEELEKMRKKLENDREVYVREITGMLKDMEEMEKDEDIKELHQEVRRRIQRNKNSCVFQ